MVAGSNPAWDVVGRIKTSKYERVNKMADFTDFNNHIEKFKAVQTPIKRGPKVNKGDKVQNDFLRAILFDFLRSIDKYLFEYQLDTPYRIYSCLDPIIQYIAVDMQNNNFICWNEDEVEGIHPARVMQRLFEIEGVDTQLDIDESESEMTIFHNGRIVKIKDNHDNDNRKIIINGRHLKPDRLRFIDGYLSLQDCMRKGMHLTSCDDDGFCDFCGENTPPDEVELEDVDFGPGGFSIDVEGD
jgi:hypothetical protein